MLITPATPTRGPHLINITRPGITREVPERGRKESHREKIGCVRHSSHRSLVGGTTTMWVRVWGGADHLLFFSQSREEFPAERLWL